MNNNLDKHISAVEKEKINLGMTFKDFKESISNGASVEKIAGEDMPGFYKRGSSMYGDTDDLYVSAYTYIPRINHYVVELVRQ